MRILEVSYERLESGPGYNNQRLGVRVAVGPDEEPADALKLAKDFVAAGLGEPLPSEGKERRNQVASQLQEIASQLICGDEECPF